MPNCRAELIVSSGPSAALVDLFKVNTGPGRLKTDYLAFEELASVIGSLPGCRARAAVLLETVTLTALGRARRLRLDPERR